MGTLITQARVEAILALMEGDGPRHRTRRFPIDMVTEAVQHECAHWPPDAEVPPWVIVSLLDRIAARN